MSEWLPVSHLFDLETLEKSEVAEGYLDGLGAAPEPGNNRTRSYWHGWRNGMVDGGHMEKDWAQIELARQVVAQSRMWRAEQ